MRYSIEPRRRKYVQGYVVLSFSRRFGDTYGKKLMDTATKPGIEAAKNASKRVFQKIAEAAGDSIGNKMVDKITSASESKNKGKENETNEIEEIIYHQKKDSKLLML